MFRRLIKDRLALICMFFLIFMIFLGLFAPMLAPNDPLQMNVKDKFASISSAYPLGTDHLGRCILSRLLFGIRTTLFLSILTMAVTIAIGVTVGVIASFFRGIIDFILMRICDVFISFPSEVMVLAIVGMMGPNLLHAVIAIIIAKWAWYARMVRSIMLTFMNKQYVDFAKVSGASFPHIAKKHLLPGALGEMIVLATLNTGSIILMLSALSFLGLGVQAPTPEWGMMLKEAKDVLFVDPTQMLAPGLFILAVVVALNFLGDSMQKALNEKRVE